MMSCPHSSTFYHNYQSLLSYDEPNDSSSKFSPSLPSVGKIHYVQDNYDGRKSFAFERDFSMSEHNKGQSCLFQDSGKGIVHNIYRKYEGNQSGYHQEQNENNRKWKKCDENLNNSQLKNKNESKESVLMDSPRCNNSYTTGYIQGPKSYLFDTFLPRTNVKAVTYANGPGRVFAGNNLWARGSNVFGTTPESIQSFKLKVENLTGKKYGPYLDALPASVQVRIKSWETLNHRRNKLRNLLENESRWNQQLVKRLWG